VAATEALESLLPQNRTETIRETLAAIKESSNG